MLLLLILLLPVVETLHLVLLWILEVVSLSGRVLLRVGSGSDGDLILLNCEPDDVDRDLGLRLLLLLGIVGFLVLCA